MSTHAASGVFLWGASLLLGTAGTASFSGIASQAATLWNEPAFRKANPDHDIVKPCVYVGMTGLDPDLRFDRHMAGVQANRFVLKYGERLMPELYEVYNPMPYEAARDMEVELAIGLREAGYGVWQA